MVPISRHYSDFQDKHESVAMAFVAPRIHDDAIRYSKFIQQDEQMNISTLSIQDFIDQVHSFA
jgi:hypothetical protein